MCINLIPSPHSYWRKFLGTFHLSITQVFSSALEQIPHLVEYQMYFSLQSHVIQRRFTFNIYYIKFINVWHEARTNLFILVQSWISC